MNPFSIAFYSKGFELWEKIKRLTLCADFTPRIRMEEDICWRNLKNLTIGMLISLFLHVLILSLAFTTVAKKPQPLSIPLEVVLVNAQSAYVPENPSVIAQANLLGGGEHQQQRARTPMPAYQQQQISDTLKSSQQKIAKLEAQQHALLAQTQQQSHPTPTSSSKKDFTRTLQNKDPQQNKKKRQWIETYQAEIARNIHHYQTRPKRAQVTASAREAIYAHYYDQLRQKIEEIGTQYFPQYAGKKLYGHLLVTITVNAKGTLGYHQGEHILEGIEINHSSGNPVLDRQAVAIIRASAPFGVFSDQLRAQYDVLEIITQMHFSREGVHTGITTRYSE